MQNLNFFMFGKTNHIFNNDYSILKIKIYLILTVVIFASLLSLSCNQISTKSNNTNLIYTSTPETSVFHNEQYSYTVTFEGEEGEVAIAIEHSPGWLSFDNHSQILFGIATGDNLGSHSVRISVSDNNETVYQNFSIEVSLKRISEGPWIGHFPYNWFHDGQPLIGENSIIYSDAASDDAKQATSERVENAFIDIKMKFNITNNDVLTFMTNNQKIDIYANRFNTEYNGGFTYNSGAIVISPDSPRFRPNAGWCANMVEHEMMHVMEYLLEGGRRLILSEVWFREGIADYYAENDEITTKSEMEDWLTTRSSLPGGGNPIKIHEWEDFPSEVAINNEQGLWYPMFELAVRYLLDENGQGKSMVDVKNMFIDMDVSEYPFPVAFELNMDLSVQYFEENFWSIMDSYLH
ncbi:putative Ig domain-containing protein [Candidatus Neomarinimicrobiota bacterium]